MDRLLVGTREARSLLGIGATKLYELINSHALERRKIGRKTLVTMDSILDVAGLADSQQETRS